MKPHRSEQGQVLVLIVLAMIGLLGFAALAIDMGVVYAERRRAQSAVDAAAMAAGYAAASGQDIDRAAMKSLALNGFTQDTDPNANPDKTQDLQVNNPPTSGPYTGLDNSDEYYQVIIQTQVQKILSQFVFTGPEKITVEAVVHVQGAASAAPDDALDAIARDYCSGIVFNGNGTTSVSGGNIHSNAPDMGSCSSIDVTGTSGSIRVTDGEVDSVGSIDVNPGFSISPAPTTHVAPSSVQYAPPPSCAGLPTRSFSGTTLQPGYYPNDVKITSGGP